MDNFATLWMVPASTKTNRVRSEFIRVFGKDNITIPSSGIMPQSTTGKGVSIVQCTLNYDNRSAAEVVKKAGQNWKIWGYQEYATGRVIVPVNSSVLAHIPDRKLLTAENSWIHRFRGQAQWQ